VTAKKSFLITLRIFFILFSLKFIRDAFYTWDGCSYYMQFKDFLPDLSLIFILYTVLGVIFAVIIWINLYGLLKILSVLIKSIRFEHLIAFFILTATPIFIKKFIFDFFPMSSLVGSNQIVRLIIACVFVVIVSWLVYKYAEKILNEIESRIKPVLWLFIILLIIAVPLSIFKSGYSEAETATHHKHVAAPSDKKRPNIILVIMDALTARDMQVYGYQRPTTPFISEWAKGAFVFNRTYSASNWTTPSTMSIMTGQRPWTHRIWYRTESKAVSNYKDNLPLILKDYGYTNYGFVQNHNANPETLGIKDAFVIRDKAYTFWITRNQWYDEYAKFFTSKHIIAEWVFENNPFINSLNLKFFRHPIFTSLIRSETVYNRFLEAISQNLEQPFFAYIHVYPPHSLYLPPKPYMGMFGNTEKFNTDEKQINSSLIDDYYPPERQKDVDDIRKRYDEFILYSDQQFKAFLIRLSKTIDMSNTIIILSSDHGESFSHGFVGHGYDELYEPLVHVPLIIKTPWNTKGQTIDMPVEQIDIAPTILEFADIPVPNWMEGRSLIPLLVVPKYRDQSREGKILEPRPLFSMQLIKNRTIGNYPITKGTIAVWDGDYKLIHYLEENKSFLFDLKADPDETKDISKEKPAIRQRLLKLMEDSLSNANTRSKQAIGPFSFFDRQYFLDNKKYL